MCDYQLRLCPIVQADVVLEQHDAPVRYRHNIKRSLRKHVDLLKTRKAAVVRKRTTAVYAKVGRNPLFKCVLQWQK